MVVEDVGHAGAEDPAPDAGRRGSGIPPEGLAPIGRAGADALGARVPELAPVAIAPAGAPGEGRSIAMIAGGRDPQATEPGVEGVVAPGDRCSGPHRDLLFGE